MRLKHIAVALDRMQRDNCMISEAVEVWQQLEKDMENASQPLSVLKKVRERSTQALTPAHFLANILDPRFRGEQLSREESDAAMEFASNISPSVLSTVVNYKAQSGPFKPYMYSHELVNTVTPLAWWHSQSSDVNQDMIKLINQLLGAVSSRAGVERIFSTFGYVHSKVRNRLGIEKAAKLVFMYKVLNAKS